MDKDDLTRSKRFRSNNYSDEEKRLLISIANKYKDILENKKTDSTTNAEKNKTWSKIAQEYNTCTSKIPRQIDSLKKFYVNSKKKIKKLVAEEKQNLFNTGDGPQDEIKINDDPLFIVGDKSVYALRAPFDSDGIYLNGYAEHVPSTGSTDSDIEKEVLQPEIKVAVLDPEETGSNSPIINKRVADKSDWSSIYKPDNSKRKGFNVRRRRPARMVKTLTSPEVAMRYERLLEKGEEIADLTLAKLRHEKVSLELSMTWQREEIDLQRQKLLLDIEIKKATLQSLSVDNVDMESKYQL